MSSTTFVAALALRRFRSRGGSGLAALARGRRGGRGSCGNPRRHDRRSRPERGPGNRSAPHLGPIRARGVVRCARRRHGELSSALHERPRGVLRTRLRATVPIVLVRESTVGGRYVGLSAIDGVAPHVRLLSGRLPRACHPERCEVLRLRGVGRLPDVPGLRIVEVGRATLRSGRLFGDFLEPSDNALGNARVAPVLRRIGRYHRPAPGPLVVAEGVAGLVSSPVLARTYRSYAWVSALGDGVPRAWDLNGTLDAIARVRSQLTAISTSWSVIEPEQELRATGRSTTAASRRLLLVGGEGVALLVAFAILAAGALRADLLRARRRLTWYGARRSPDARTRRRRERTHRNLGHSCRLGSRRHARRCDRSCLGERPGRRNAYPCVRPVAHRRRSRPWAHRRHNRRCLGCGLDVATRTGPLGAAEVVAGVAILLVAVALLGGSVDDESLRTAVARPSSSSCSQGSLRSSRPSSPAGRPDGRASARRSVATGHAAPRRESDRAARRDGRRRDRVPHALSRPRALRGDVTPRSRAGNAIRPPLRPGGPGRTRESSHARPRARRRADRTVRALARPGTVIPSCGSARAPDAPKQCPP